MYSLHSKWRTLNLAYFDGRVLCIVPNSGVLGLVSFSLGFSKSANWEQLIVAGSMWNRSGVFCWNLWTRSAIETKGEASLAICTEIHLCSTCRMESMIREVLVSGSEELGIIDTFWVTSVRGAWKTGWDYTLTVEWSPCALASVQNRNSWGTVNAIWFFGFSSWVLGFTTWICGNRYWVGDGVQFGVHSKLRTSQARSRTKEVNYISHKQILVD